MIELDVTSQPLSGRLNVEASAGTGKTYSVSALVVREIAMRDDLRISQILVTTFTRNAAAELRDRIRRRLVETAVALRGGVAAANDETARALLDADPAERLARAGRLERAAVEFDTSTIATIHSIASRVLRVAGVPVPTDGDEDHAARVRAEVVNDELVRAAVAGRIWDESRFAAVVAALCAHPDAVPVVPEGGDVDGALVDALLHCRDEVFRRLRVRPGFDDLLRLAVEVVESDGFSVVREQLVARFSIAVVDEAQDTDPLQWRLFDRLFPVGDPRALVAVGDPKQAIYRFRGADVSSYVRFADTCERTTLRTNHRSDAPLLEGLNAAFGNTTFGEGIEYRSVGAGPGNAQSRFEGLPPVQFVDLGEVSNQGFLIEPTVRRVVQLVRDCRIDDGGRWREVAFGDVCVLVATTSVGRSIEKRLRELGVPAVSGGTESVMRGEIADDVLTLLEAMERPSIEGRLRQCAATVFFGRSLREAGLLSNDLLVDVADRIGEWTRVLRISGVAGLATALQEDADVMRRLSAGTSGERRLTDLAHVAELMHSASAGRSTTPTEALEVFHDLARQDDSNELVSRRVESDARAVQILTVHGAKGLQFPCVVVADLWKDQAGGAGKSPNVARVDGRLVVDAGFVTGETVEAVAAAAKEEQRDERKRMLYVAATRAKHHVTIVHRSDPNDNVAVEVFRSRTPSLNADDLPPANRITLPSADAGALVHAPPPSLTPRRFLRTSYSRLTESMKGDDFARPGGGRDEPSVESRDVVVADLPAGTAVGTTVHEVLERIDPSSGDLEAEVAREVESLVRTGPLAPYRSELAGVLVSALRTPFGHPIGETTYASAAGRLREMEFDLAVADLSFGVEVADVGRVLLEFLAADDPLRPYAESLVTTFTSPVGGIVTGSIDALLLLPGGGPVRLVVSDYKSNRLHEPGSSSPISAYAPSLLFDEMARHHYPLQALLYGTAAYRFARWRLGADAARDAVVGFAYGFLRGMVGPDTPVDGSGRRYGVCAWSAPEGLFPRLSDLLAGDRP